MSNEQIEKLDRGDVYLEEIKPPDCDNCSIPAATHQIRLDFRELGTSVVLRDRYCAICAAMMAERLKATLPPEVAL